MGLLSEIRNNVDATVEPTVESLIHNFNVDEDLDSSIELACEALNVEMQEHDEDPDIYANLTPDEIAALIDAGTEEEDVDDDMDLESAEALLADLPDAQYNGNAETDELDDEDESFIDDDFTEDDFDLDL